MMAPATTRIAARVVRLETVERRRDGGEVGQIGLTCAAGDAVQMALAGLTGQDVEIEIRVVARGGR